MKKILEGLNSEQKKAVINEGGAMLVLAGAGSGKTRVITRRIAYLISEKKINPAEILAVTFTNKAAAEMKGRISQLLGDINIPWAGTFHSICARILRIEMPALGKTADFTIIDSGDQLSLIRECLRDMNVDEKVLDPRRVRSSISSAKNQLKMPEDFASQAHGWYPEKVSQIYDLYQKKLALSNCFDFDDLIMQAVLILQNNTNILNKYQDRFRHVLVDEYQDVNYSQYMLAKILSGKHENICVVGDDDQSIYGFRGADVSIILRFEKDFPGAKIFKLEENYRSTQVILEAANAVVSNNSGRKEKKLWTQGEKGERIGSHASLDGREEARFIIKEINKWHEKEHKFRDFVVLYRTNAQSRSLEEVLKQEGIDYDIVGGLRFYERAEIKDAIAYLKLILNHRDYISYRRVVNVPIRGVGNVTADKIIQESIKTGNDLLEVMKDAKDIPRIGGKLNETLLELSSTLENLSKEREKLLPSDFINMVLDKVGYFEMLKSENDPQKYERIENLEELINDAKEFEMVSQDRSLEAFLQKVSLFTDIDSKKDYDPNQEGKVTLMTIHSAKGLEFPVVFVAGLEEGLFPHFRSIDENRESAMEEERRLFYVSITRAIKKLYLTYARERMVHGRLHNQSPSRFLREIPEDLIDSYLPEVAKRKFTRKVSSILDETHHTTGKKDRFKPGDRVYHKIFGAGIVSNSEKGYVTADFEGMGKKILSQDYLNPYGAITATFNPGDRVKIKDGNEGVLKKEEGDFAYVILTGGDVEKFSRDLITLAKD